ncbi:TPA: CTP synthase [Candidatus Woesearchaeota archaeon]|nr:CTP synthase [Candidatus Woesearchaeota archaeon]
MVKYIMVAGGVMSGVGKGVTTASIGKILQAYGYKVTAIKIDPYLNFDAGTLRPTEHGEVWVTDDGGEIDQDLGNYERFFGFDVPKKNNMTTGQIYKAVIDRERKGEYLGQTVQFIPHIIDEIKARIRDAANGYDIAMVEIGGTVGDFENVPFLFAMKSIERDVGEDDVMYMLITYLPTPSHIEEMKTKPTQQAIKLLNNEGIFPDFIICRAKKPLDDIRKKKIETYVNIASDHVISEPDIDTIYRIPLELEKESLGIKILEHFHLRPKHKVDLSAIESLVKKIQNPTKELTIAIVGKYVDIGDYDLADSYISINQALIHAGAHMGIRVNTQWIDAKKIERGDKELDKLKSCGGAIVPGGFGNSGVEGKIKAIQYCREHKLPFLGLCYGMQLAVVEFARNVCGKTDAHTTEIAKDTKSPVIDILESQKDIIKKQQYGGTMRLGAYAAILKKDTLVYELYEKTGRLKADREKLKAMEQKKGAEFRLGVLEHKPTILERHRHRYEVNPAFVEELEKQGLVFSGYHKLDGKTSLMEFIELQGHPFFIGTQAHPEFKSRLEDPAPLFLGLVEAAAKGKK